MTKEEIYKTSDVLNTILDNYLHGGEAAEVVTKFEDELIKSNLTKEEPVSDDFTIALAECIHQAQGSVVDPMVFAEIWKDELIKLAKSEEPVSEELEEASKEWLRPQLEKSYANYGEKKMMELTHFDGYAMLDAIEFGAKWQKSKDESITEDLGEYINELYKQFPEVSFAKLSRIAVRVAKWEKEQMMAKAFDGHATFEFYGLDSKTYGTIAHDPICFEDFEIKDSDKVKMFLIKKD